MWNSDTIKARWLRWMLFWSIAGLLVPIMLTARYLLFNSSFGTMEAILWPASIGLMGLEGPPRSKFDIASVYAVLMGLNIALYAALGLVSTPIGYFTFWRRTSA